MAEMSAEKDRVRTGAQAENAEPGEKPKKSTSTKTKGKGKKKGAKKPPKKVEGSTVPKPDGCKSEEFRANVIHDSETAKERGRNGGLKSGEVRRAKKNAREAIQYMLGRMAKSDAIRENLRGLGIEEVEFSNMMALQARLFTKAMTGDLESYMTLMRMGGYEPEELRKERESLAADRRRELELDAKIEALGQGKASEVAMNLQDEDGDNDVVIYMPQIVSEEECELSPDSPAAEESAE